MKVSVSKSSSTSFLSVSTAVLLFVCFPVQVQSQCPGGNGDTCLWSNDGSSALLWISETTAGETFIKLEKCGSKKCGIGTIISPWLPPSTSAHQLTFYFKVYGDNNVYLKLFLKKENQNTGTLIFTKSFNYGDSYPETWTWKTVLIPPTDARYQLIMEARATYNEAFVAVKGIEISGRATVPGSTSTSSSTSTTSSTRRPGVSTSSTTTTTSTTTAGSDIEFPDDDREREDDRNEMSQALEERLITAEDLNLGHTTVVYPDICKY